MTASTQRGIPTSLLPLLTTTGTGVAVVIPISARNVRVHVRGVGAIGAGTLIIEEALDPAFTGTWSQLASITATTLANGVEQVFHFIGTIAAIRIRVSVNVTVGTVSADIVSD